MNDFIQKLFRETPMGGFQGLDLVQIDSNDHMFLLVSEYRGVSMSGRLIY